MSPKVSELYKEQKRTQILEAAKRAFIHNGYELTTMKDIIEESGFSRGGVYLYFSSAEEIFLELMKMNDDSWIQMLNRVSDQQENIWNAILELITNIKNSLNGVQKGIGPVIYEYFMTSKRNVQAERLLETRFQTAQKNLQRLMDEGTKREQFHPRYDTREISTYILSFLDGLELNLISHGTQKVNLDAQLEQFIDYLKYALQVPSDRWN